MNPAMTPHGILERIQRELTLFMGPLAPVILSDKAAEFEMNMSDFPSDRIAELVEEVSFEIQNHRRKVEFQRAALRILREAAQEVGSACKSVGSAQNSTASPGERAPAETSSKPDAGGSVRRRLRLAEDKPWEGKS